MLIDNTCTSSISLNIEWRPQRVWKNSGSYEYGNGSAYNGAQLVVFLYYFNLLRNYLDICIYCMAL